MKLPPSDPTTRPPAPERPASADEVPAPEAEVLEVERRVVKWWHPVLLLAALALLYWFADTIEDVIGLRSLLGQMRDTMEAMGAQGPLLFIVVYVVLTLLWIPGSWLTLVAGALFGSLIGIAVVIVSSTVSAALAFLISRHWLQHRVEARIGRNKRFQQLNRLTDRHGPVVVLVVRLLNLFPFALVNYGFGLTRIPFRTYLLWSFLGKIPGTVVMVVGIDAIIDAIVERQIPWGMVAVVIVMTTLLAVLLRTLHHRLEATGKPEGEHDRGTP